MLPPIFITGCQRSGTTLLRKIIDSHSRIACPPESAFIDQFVRVFEIKRSLEGLLSMGFSEEEVLTRMGNFVREFFEDYMKRKGKSRWADKTPHYVDHLESIDRMFGGNPVYVCIVRHGLDVAYSLSRFDWGLYKRYEGMSKPEAAVAFWREQNDKILDFMKHAGKRAMLLKYEELVAAPEKKLEEVFLFLDEPWEESVLRYHEFSHDEGYGDTEPIVQQGFAENIGNYRKWPEELIQKLYEREQIMFERLGYVI